MRIISRTLLCLSLIAGCGGEEAAESVSAETDESSETAEANVEPTPEPPLEADPAQAATPVESMDSYTVTFQAQDNYPDGELAQVSLRVEGQDGWHLNQDFPFSIELAHEDAISTPKDELGKADAASFDDDAAVFDVPVTATGVGDHAVTATVNFAVCSPDSCVPHTAVVAVQLAVVE